MATSMDELMRSQYANAQTAFARRQQGNALAGNPLTGPTPTTQVGTTPTAPVMPPAQTVPNQTWLLHPPGQPAPKQHFNFEPGHGGSWRIYPPGVQAPGHGPQGTLPVMPPSYDHLKSLGDDLDRQFGQGAPPPVPGPFSSAPPRRSPGLG